VKRSAIGFPSIGLSYIADGPKYAEVTNALLRRGELKPAPIFVMPKGLASVNDAFRYMKDDKVRFTTV
jgi:hypothetical protein